MRLSTQLPLAYLRLIATRIRRYPKLSALLALLLLYGITYFALWRIHVSWFGRWYWNYIVATHPALAYLLPSGRWGPIENPPRSVTEILNAPWMGEWDIPQLTAPVYAEPPERKEIPISPVFVKLHIFSTPPAASKRNVIRSVSPLLSISPEYRHLIEVRFVFGYVLNGWGEIDSEAEEKLQAENDVHGDLLRLSGLKNGENLREGKIMEWMRAVGTGKDGGREAQWVFKVDDDTVLNLPNLLDTLLKLDPSKPTYIGTSLNRFPAYPYHFTGIMVGMSWGVLKTLSAGIGEMSRQDIEAWWDDDVLLGELMYTLPSGPQCQTPLHTIRGRLPSYCDPHRPPVWGYLPPPPSPDRRTDLIRYDLLRHAGDQGLWWIKGDLARHPFKNDTLFLEEWDGRVKGKIWRAPKGWERFAEPSGPAGHAHPS